jgi:hypothetical protein
MNEFDDVVVDGSFRLSVKARAEMTRLSHEHSLGFVFNPGGGEFNGRGFHCQISTYDDIDDLSVLRKALAERGYISPGGA